MQWIDDYDFFLFDLDGLLVNTEPLHFRSYQKMCLDRGVALPWSFEEYCALAHAGADWVKNKIYETFPALYAQEPNWNVLYGEKKKAILQLLAQEEAPLLPGVQEVLQILEEKKKKRCVVTHSLQELAFLIRERNLFLQSIPHWITREQYDRPKPFPDAYLKAVELYGTPRDKMIGFEDTVRGWKALQSASIPGVVISSVLGEEFRAYLISNRVPIYSSFRDLLQIDHLS